MTPDPAVQAIIDRCNAHSAEQRTIAARVATYDAHPDREIEARIRELFKAGMSHADVCSHLRKDYLT